MLTQHKIEAGIKAFGQTENKEVLKKLNQKFVKESLLTKNQEKCLSS